MAGVADDLWEGHALTRDARLPGGPNGANYGIRVQDAVTNNTIALTLGDWFLSVRTNL
jgi:hypothetical protein